MALARLLRFEAIVTELGVEAGIEVPPVRARRSRSMTAAQTGFTWRGGAVVWVNPDAAEQLSRPALRFLAAHELGHVRQYDRSAVTTLERTLRWAPVGLAVGVLASFVTISIARIGSSSLDTSWMLSTITPGFVCMLACYFGHAALRRRLEVGADAFAVELLGTDDGAAETLLWAQALGERRRGRPAKRSRLDTHPPIGRRLQLMREHAHRSGTDRTGVTT